MSALTLSLYLAGTRPSGGNVGASFPQGQRKLSLIMRCPYYQAGVHKLGFDCKLMQVLSMLFINQLLITLMSFCYRAYSVTFNSISSKDCVEVHEKKKKVAVLCFHPPQKGTFML